MKMKQKKLILKPIEKLIINQSWYYSSSNMSSKWKSKKNEKKLAEVCALFLSFFYPLFNGTTRNSLYEPRWFFLTRIKASPKSS